MEAAEGLGTVLTAGLTSLEVAALPMGRAWAASGSAVVGASATGAVVSELRATEYLNNNQGVCVCAYVCVCGEGMLRALIGNRKYHGMIFI
jgi:hypothetical protein